MDDAAKDALYYLRTNIMSFDIPNLETLGFHNRTRTIPVPQWEANHMERDQRHRMLSSLSALPDGLGEGVATISVPLALQTKTNYPWTDDLTRDMFFEYVLNYANANEARTNWRPFFTHALNQTMNLLLQQQRQQQNRTVEMKKVVKLVNLRLWTLLGKSCSKVGVNGCVEVDYDESFKIPIWFKSGQTPLVYDPMSVVAFGYASCTGISIVLVNALRAVGVPARLVGTPAWNGSPENGNHNWIEVYLESQWHFMEGSPAAGDSDNLDKNPCDHWFCNRKSFGPGTHTRVYASRLDQSVSDFYPMAWDPDNHDVPGEDRTDDYRSVCGQC